MTNTSDMEDRLANEQLDAIDDAVMASVAELYRNIDPMPEGLVERVTFAMTLDALHTEVAELQRLSTGSLSYRSGAADEIQTVTFTSASLTTMVTISGATAAGVRIDGWIAPGAQVEVELRLETGSLTTTADDDGRFVFESVPHGMAQFILRVPGENRSPVVTPSMEL